MATIIDAVMGVEKPKRRRYDNYYWGGGGGWLPKIASDGVDGIARKQKK
jgi:hypothetical protein